MASLIHTERCGELLCCRLDTSSALNWGQLGRCALSVADTEVAGGWGFEEVSEVAVPLADPCTRISCWMNGGKSEYSDLSRSAHSTRQLSGSISFTIGSNNVEKLSDETPSEFKALVWAVI